MRPGAPVPGPEQLNVHWSIRYPRRRVRQRVEDRLLDSMTEPRFWMGYRRELRENDRLLT